MGHGKITARPCYSKPNIPLNEPLSGLDTPGRVTNLPPNARDASRLPTPAEFVILFTTHCKIATCSRRRQFVMLTGSAIRRSGRSGVYPPGLRTKHTFACPWTLFIGRHFLPHRTWRLIDGPSR
jgi:hypothetical protein